MTPGSPLRVAINATALLSPRTGIGNYVFELGKAFLAMPEVHPRFFYSKNWSDELRNAPLSNIVSIKSKIRKFVPDAYAIARFLIQRNFNAGVRKEPIDLYHEPNYLAYRFAGPTVTTVHDLSWIRHPETHPKERLQAMSRYFPQSLEQSAAIITDCAFVKNEVVEVFGVSPDKIHPVLLGVSSDFSPVSAVDSRAVLEKHGLAFGQYFLCVGTLEPRKNLPTLIDAFLALPSAIQQHFPLALVGMRGWLTSGLEKKMQPLVDKGLIRALGYVEDAHMPALYSGSAAFIFPSLYEGFGLPPLEAMACGAPVIASQSSSIPEVVGGAGVLCDDPLDAQAFADAMQRIVEDETWRKQLSTASLAQASLFSWKKTAQDTLNVYRQVLRRL